MAIFSYLLDHDLCRCSVVSRKWRTISNNESLWRSLCKESWEGKKGWSGLANLSVDQVASALVTKNALSAAKLPLNDHVSWKLWLQLSHKDSQRTCITVDEMCGDWILHIGINQKCDPIPTRFESDFSFSSENTGVLKWEMVGNAIKLPDFPPLQVARTADWGWRLYCPYFAFYKAEA
ncbi:hypothetical protein K493DRAFT_302960 [Basidiobolus meristosporus CBS 931.73]|uniref:F-box domain-containing protein n=1 Tax=Basidiobolus meristosporus CBS 931.73 TaxID=1314790 RepID=A0A1Y1Y4Q0_9FUNG|nr:hypothetical protein K493DRAFT_302960 [Basidiobolus meristosporus CBS 931.73]|eukprot:ORX92990.1 hypothetical protein K493DRAFT_302960 [Basidiobolus meristosporus CBS 931.73]